MSVLVVVTGSTELSDWHQATSPGLLKPSDEKFVLSMLYTTPPTTNWSVPRLWSKVASLPSILLHSDNGMKLTSTDQNQQPFKRKSMPAERKPKLPPHWLNNFPKVVSLHELLPDQVKLDDAMDIFLKAKNLTSTSENSRPRNPNKSKDSNK